LNNSSPERDYKVEKKKEKRVGEEIMELHHQKMTRHHDHDHDLERRFLREVQRDHDHFVDQMTCVEQHKR
jgi:hypothetical protein